MANINVCIGSRLRKGRSLNQLNQIENDAIDVAKYIYNHYGWRFSNDMQIALAEVPCEKGGGKSTMISYQLTWCNSGTKKTRSCEIFKSESTCNKTDPTIHDYHGFTRLVERLRAGTLNKILK